MDNGGILRSAQHADGIWHAVALQFSLRYSVLGRQMVTATHMFPTRMCAQDADAAVGDSTLD
jgi:hypothetical protein